MGVGTVSHVLTAIIPGPVWAVLGILAGAVAGFLAGRASKASEF